MKITDVVVERFRGFSRTVSDSEGHGHPGPEREVVISLTRIVTDDGAWGICLGGSQEVADGVIKPAIVGEDPFYREKIWHRLNERQRLHKGVLSDRAIWRTFGFKPHRQEYSKFSPTPFSSKKHGILSAYT